VLDDACNVILRDADPAAAEPEALSAAAKVLASTPRVCGGLAGGMVSGMRRELLPAGIGESASLAGMAAVSRAGWRSAGWAAMADIACVLVFVVIGRASHGRGETLGGVASTAWPFLAGLGAGWLAARAWARPAAIWPAGAAAWLGTVAVGMALRVIAGQGTAVAFILAALAFVGLFLLGWRLVTRLTASPICASGRTGGPSRASAWRGSSRRACRWPRRRGWPRCR